MITKMVNMDRLNMKKVCAKIPKNLTQEQKDNRKNIGSDILKRITEQSDVLENVTTCDET
jgi:hypothetical protein